MDNMQIIDLYKGSVNFIKHRISAKPIDSYREQHIKMIAQVIDKYNHCLLLAEGYEKRIWDDLIDKADTMSEFIIDETTTFFKYNISSESDFHGLIDHICFCQTILKGTNSAIDKEVVLSMPDLKSAVQNLKDNPWLLYLILLIDSIAEIKQL